MKFYFYSLGCKVNSYETSAIRYLLCSKGHIEDKDNPDFIIINTCSVTAVADQKSRQHIRKMQRDFPNAKIMVMGCYAQKNHDFIFNDLKVDFVTGTSNRDKIAEIIDNFSKYNDRLDLTNEKTRIFSYEELGVASLSENVRAYLKIQDGCDNFCSYCLIPFVRGKSRSRDLSSIISEAKFLVDSGYKEIVLTGIHVGGYGKDLDGLSFSKLVEELLKIDNLYRLRISSIEESEIDDRLIELLAKCDKLAKHLHIPLQSGCDETLLRMNRKYSTTQFLNQINHIRQMVPDIAITTDVIVGFPGETDEEFSKTYNFIKECNFNMLHVFPFSSREGTKASVMSNQINPDVKKYRSKELLNYSDESWRKYCERFIGQTIDVLIEEEKDGYFVGHTSNYLYIKLQCSTAKVGDIVHIKLTKDMIIS